MQRKGSREEGFLRRGKWVAREERERVDVSAGRRLRRSDGEYRGKQDLSRAEEVLEGRVQV